MPRYLPPMNDTSRYNGGFQLGDGRRSYPSISQTPSGGSTNSSR